MTRSVLALLLGLLGVVGCARSVVEGAGATSTTAGPADSMISVFRTEAGILLVDLGWWGAERRLRSELASLGAEPADVAMVFLTHAHRDHVAAWPLVRSATFVLAEAEAPYFFGEAEYEGWIPRMADRVLEPPHPGRDEIELVTFAADTAFVVGRDTVRAFLVPGHTPGSTAYLVRGILFVGDAMAATQLGFRPAMPGFSDDVAEAEASLRSLFERVRAHDVRYVCTAHARCAVFDDALIEDALGEALNRGSGPPARPGRDRGT
jgi:glyoxylase-like metal-dependent hydrolase (beta-lactamase superfamily II)